MKTIWGEALDSQAILQEYPRPQLVRNSYINLNGPWEYAFTRKHEEPHHYMGTILVPFSPECKLSGVSRTLHADEALWYRRKLTLPEGFVPKDGRVILHFGAVDQEATVFLNGQQIGYHMGGYTAFSVDLTPALQAENTLVLRVMDDTDATWHSRGKQKTNPKGIWYSPQSGIWQTVWLEAVPSQYITGLTIIPSAQEGRVEITVHGNTAGECTLHVGQGMLGYSTPSTPPAPAGMEARNPYPLQVHGTLEEAVSIPLPNPLLWSPETPYLYPFTCTFGTDTISSYFGLRDTAICSDQAGDKRLYLNGKPYFHNGLLDQGYWPDGLYTPPSDEALIYDIEAAKELGFTMLRKHIKVEAARWYYHCDRLGMLVWQDMVNGGGNYSFWTISTPLVTGLHQQDRHYKRFARQDTEGRQEYLMELEEMVLQLQNHPSLVLWVPFNEGWGQFDAAAVYDHLHQLDPTRPIDHASGWHDQKKGDLKSLHVYFRPYRFRKDPLGRAVALTEFGGYNLQVQGHCWNKTDYGYKRLTDPDALWAAYVRLYEEQILPAIPKGLCATVYTQLCDVETELNGLMTYDRKVLKLPKEALKSLNQRVIDASPQA